MSKTVPSEQEDFEEPAVLVSVGCVMAVYGQTFVDLICLPKTKQKQLYIMGLFFTYFQGGLKHSFSSISINI